MNAEAVKARLRNLSIKEGGTMQDKLMTYALERTIYRLSVSEYADHFVLKGGIFLYALFDRHFARATVDIDLLGQRISNNAEEIKKIFKNVFSIEYDDALRYDMGSLAVHNITEFKEYYGVNVSINAYLDRTRIPVSIDIGFGDVLFPDRIQIEFPVLLDMEEPKLFAYSVYSVIAEKFEIFTSLGLVNSRYKDFYDIYILARNFDLSGSELQMAIQETFLHRGTSFEDIAAFENEYIEDAVRQNRWEAFVRKKKAIEGVSFKEVITGIKMLLKPIVDSIQSDSTFDKKWLHEEKQWK